MKKKWLIPALAIILVAVILIGEVIASSGGYSYGSDAERNGNTVSYSVSSSGTNDYNAVLIDNHGFQRVTELVIYADESYDEYYKQANEGNWIYYNESSYYAEQLQKSLKLRSVDKVTIVDSKGLAEYVERTSSDPKGYGIISVSFSLPGDIYSGHATDKLMKWIDNGGSLYWTSSIPGKYYYSDGKMNTVENCQELFFGASGCIWTGDTETDKYCTDGITKSLVLKNHYIYLGLDTNKVHDYLSVGFNYNGVSSDTFVKKGNGMIAQFGGGFQIEQMEDIAQTIASGICYKSTFIDDNGGRLTRTTVNGSFESSAGDVIYIYIGQNYAVYGRAYDV